MLDTTIKTFVGDVLAKAGAVKALAAKIEETRAVARFPQPARIERTMEPMSDGAGVSIRHAGDQGPGATTYTVRETPIPAERDPLEDLKRQRDEEIGLAHIEGRARKHAHLDKAIADVEGARAAIPILERRHAEALAELEAVRKAHHEAMLPLLVGKFEVARDEYELALEGIRAALGRMYAVHQVATSIDRVVGIVASFDNYLHGLRHDGLVTRRGPNHLGVVEWLDGRIDLPAAGEARAKLEAELAI